MTAARRRHAVVVAATAALLASGCGGEKERPVPEVVLGDADTGALVTLPVGARLVLRLESNPSTGYTWTEAESPGAVLRATSEPAFEAPAAPSGAPTRVGAPGHQVFGYEVLRTGSTRIVLVYTRPWERGVPPARRFDVQLVVR